MERALQLPPREALLRGSCKAATPAAEAGQWIGQCPSRGAAPSLKAVDNAFSVNMHEFPLLPNPKVPLPSPART